MHTSCAGQFVSRGFVGLLRKSNPQNPNLQTAAVRGVIQGNMRKIVTKVKRGRKIKEINFPENILTENHHNMSLVQVRSVLVRVILAERKSSRINNNRKLMPYWFRLKSKRLQLAKYFSSQGGKVSPLLFYPRLPSGIKWPGIIGLVETKPYESKLIINV